MTPPGWLVSVSDWPFKAAEAAVDLSNWLRTLQLPQLTRDCSQMCNKIQFGLVLCKDVPTLGCIDIILFYYWLFWNEWLAVWSEHFPTKDWPLCGLFMNIMATWLILFQIWADNFLKMVAMRYRVSPTDSANLPPQCGCNNITVERSHMCVISSSGDPVAKICVVLRCRSELPTGKWATIFLAFLECKSVLKIPPKPLIVSEMSWTGVFFVYQFWFFDAFTGFIDCRVALG